MTASDAYVTEPLPTAGPTTVFVVRHGEPTQGSNIDPALSDAGNQQAERLAEWLMPEWPAAVYASTMRRAVQTAEPLARRLGVEVRQLVGLREGVSMRTHYVKPNDLAHADQGHAFAKARFDDFIPEHDRVDLPAAMLSALRDVGAAHPGRKVVVVSHGGGLNTLLAHANGAPRVLFVNPGYAAFSRLQVWPDGRLVIASVNEAAHLDPERIRVYLDHVREGMA